MRKSLGWSPKHSVLNSYVSGTWEAFRFAVLSKYLRGPRFWGRGRPNIYIYILICINNDSILLRMILMAKSPIVLLLVSKGRLEKQVRLPAKNIRQGTPEECGPHKRARSCTWLPLTLRISNDRMMMRSHDKAIASSNKTRYLRVQC